MAVREERQLVPIFNYPMHLLKEESHLPKCQPAPLGLEPRGWAEAAQDRVAGGHCWQSPRDPQERADREVRGAGTLPPPRKAR